jgi:4-alpha-glucanotransferase
MADSAHQHRQGRFHTGRHAGILVPLFSIPSSRSWGIGEIGDLEPLAAWLRTAGQDLVQLLPVNEMARGQNSPYSAMSAQAVDPIYLSVHAVDDFAALGGEYALDGEAREALAEVRAKPRVDHRTVRGLKEKALRAAFERFVDCEWDRGTPRAERLAGFIEAERWWLDDYTLFRALHARFGEREWTSWPDGLRSRDPSALNTARHELGHEIVFYQYLQWLANVQWTDARERAGGVGLFGDFQFMVGSDSADVWARQHEFRLDASIGVPPDAFSETGQNWGLPVYRWDVMRQGDYAWLRQRAERSAELYDGYRVDHLVGFYRTYVRERNGRDRFVPSHEDEQRAQGERLLALFAEPGTRIIAEDLGTVPDFVRASLARLGVPGYRVLRWEREWHQPAQPFRDPVSWPASSVATTGTHDTETTAEWWDATGGDERRQIGALPALRSLGDLTCRPFDAELRDALLTSLFSAGSDFLILPIQDIFGWRDRINRPATVNDINWTYRLPWRVDCLADQPEARERAAFLRRLAAQSRRGLADGSSL